MKFAIATRAITIVALCTLATACGSGSSGGGTSEESESPPLPPVGSQSPDQSADQSMVEAPDISELPESGGLISLAAGEVITGSLATSQEAIIRVPNGAEVILTSDTGDVDLFLITEPVFRFVMVLRYLKNTIAEPPSMMGSYMHQYLRVKIPPLL